VRCLTEAASWARGIESLFKEVAALKEQVQSAPSEEPLPSISPWSSEVHITSPDGKTTAVIEDAMEVGMGAPTAGLLRLSNGMTFERCNPSLVWSADSAYLAVPQWMPDRSSD